MIVSLKDTEIYPAIEREQIYRRGILETTVSKRLKDIYLTTVMLGVYLDFNLTFEESFSMLVTVQNYTQDLFLLSFFSFFVLG